MAYEDKIKVTPPSPYDLGYAVGNLESVISVDLTPDERLSKAMETAEEFKLLKYTDRPQFISGWLAGYKEGNDVRPD